MLKPIKILLVEDSIVDTDLILRALRQSGLMPEWTRVDTEADFIHSLHAGLDLVLSDYLLPQFTGLRALELLKKSGLDIPLIIISGTIGEETAVAAMKLGAADYLFKDRLARIGHSVKHAVAESVLRRAQQQAEKRLHHLAHHDALTSLPNRTLFYETLSKTLKHASSRGYQAAILFIDIDHFKNVNDTLGHVIGDELLVQFSERLVQCVRVRDTVGRLGGDEFALILVVQQGQKSATLTANKIREALEMPFALKGYEVRVTVSIGITIFPEDAMDPETLIQFADTAMYRAKKEGRDTYRFFIAQMNIEVLARLDLEMALRKALKNEEFVLYYQPQILLKDGCISGLEALLRWERPGHGLISPNDFIPLLEETGLIVRVGAWVIAEACRQMAIWKKSGIGPIQVSVNVSGRQFLESDLQENIMGELHEHGVEPHLLELELTESTLMTNVENSLICMGNLRSLGVKIAIDDFGTGYSSLAYLRRFPVDKLKIDIAFICNIITNQDDAAIALAIINLAHALKLEVVAEGVETLEQLKFLRRKHCDHIQGYYISKPLHPAEMTRMLQTKKRLPGMGARR